MAHPSFEQFLKSPPEALAKGPVAMVFVEDAVEVPTTLRHHIDLGFSTVLALMPDEFSLPDEIAQQVLRLRFESLSDEAMRSAVSQLANAATGTWFYYCYNAEYLFYPFCESRSIGEMLAFHSEERRDAMLTYVVDLYADDLVRFPNAVSLEHAHLDKSGYYALARKGSDDGAQVKDRQLDFFGGLRWRYEEHIPKPRRKIDRISLFRGKQGLTLRADHTFNDEEYNTYACPWHHNLTAAVCSFRTAKALKRNPGSTFDIDSFRWHNSTPFEWNSRQLLDLGLMEPGQWF